MLVLEIEYLNRVSYAARYNSSREAEWPPHPDRVFMALVDAWGTFGHDPSEGRALEWLESQDPPDIAAPEARHRTGFKNFVPTSANSAKGLGYLHSSYIQEITSGVIRKERHFPAVVLPDDDTTVRMIWRDAKPDGAVVGALSGMAGRVSRIGHSASLTRVAVSEGPAGVAPTHVPDESGGDLLRCPSPGRLRMLVSEFESAADSMVPSWPSTARTRRYTSTVEGDIAESVMAGADEWVVLSAYGGFAPVLRAFPVVAKAMRDAIMSHAAEPVHEAISGHSAGGGALQGPHLAILPMANVGWGRYSDGELMGIALVMPRISSYGADERRQLRRAVSGLLDSGGSLRMGRFGSMSLRRDDGSRSSLLPDRYAAVSRVWASVTPVVLDHHPKKGHSAEDIIADGCERVNLPRPASVFVSRHSRVSGAPPAFAGKGRDKDWLPPKPGFLDNKFVCHAVVTFDRDVRGPVLLGAARYYGMGMFVPLWGGLA